MLFAKALGQACSDCSSITDQDAYYSCTETCTGAAPSSAQTPPSSGGCPAGYVVGSDGGCYTPGQAQAIQQSGASYAPGLIQTSFGPAAKAPTQMTPVATPWYKNPLYIGLIGVGVIAVGGGAYYLARS